MAPPCAARVPLRDGDYLFQNDGSSRKTRSENFWKIKIGNLRLEKGAEPRRVRVQLFMEVIPYAAPTPVGTFSGFGAIGSGRRAVLAPGGGTERGEQLVTIAMRARPVRPAPACVGCSSRRAWPC